MSVIPPKSESKQLNNTLQRQTSINGKRISTSDASVHKKTLHDIQSQTDTRGLPLHRVGITNLSYPLSIKTAPQVTQSVNTTINFFVDLPHDKKGTHMSRFSEILYDSHPHILDYHTLKKVLTKAQKKFSSIAAILEISFRFYMIKKAPISRKESYIDYECKIIAELHEEKYNYRIVLRVPTMLLCPCSKAISLHNAHNQRSVIEVDVKTNKNVFIGILAQEIESEGSCELYSLLKREDEKFVTEKSYENPKFVEDVVRDVALKLKLLPSVEEFSVICESFESIHNHNAYAEYKHIISI
jgi:GTP cyclohydrolase I